MEPTLSSAQVILGFFVALATLIGAVAAASRFVFVPRIRELVTQVVKQEFEEREEENARIAEAEKTAIESLATRIGAIEDRMSQNEKAAAETKATVERIEDATKRQTVTLEAIVEGIGEIKEGFVVQREKVKRAEEDIKELQRTRRRTR